MKADDWSTSEVPAAVEAPKPAKPSKADRAAVAQPVPPVSGAGASPEPAPEVQTTTDSPPSEAVDAPVKRGRGRPPRDPNATTPAPAAPKELSALSLSELGKALTKALAKAKAGAEALVEAETINVEIAKRLG
jgi:hypothetical protein